MKSSNLRATVTVHAYAVTVVDDSQRAGAPPHESQSPPSVVVMPTIDDVVGGVYRLKRLLGAGMFGKVYVAQREDVPEHQVALKILPRSHFAGRNVERELVMLATVGHPNVVQMKDHGTTPEYVWLTMPVYRGETLAERLERGPLGLREAHDVFLAIARGLEALHGAGLRHQDIKPDNIFLATFGGRVHPILLDLGVAAECEGTFVAGTALYASPEQLAAMRGNLAALPISEKMDTYCLAATLLVSLVGEDRYPGSTANTMDDLERALEVRATHPLPDGTLAEVRGEARELIDRALARWLAHDPRERPAMSELAEELDVLLEPEREIARAEERQRQKQRASLQAFRVSAGALLLLAAAGAVVAFSKRETLKLATELERARAEGARQFDQVEICNASYKTAMTDVDKCKASASKDKKLFEEQLDAQMKLCESGSELDCAIEIKKVRDQSAARLQTCEETAEKAEAEWKRREAEWDKQRVALGNERDEQRTLAEKKAEELKKLGEERDRCVADQKACSDEREKLRAEVKSSGAGATSPASSASVSPSPSLTSIASVGPPPPPPPPPAPPPPPPPPPAPPAPPAP
ncbi:serine/threonine protein kinase [Polyangium jinanense]|uniref:Protein kinase n=1 Tax=Polyangium jinanense TaxID=2829994 RepID=A0A9X4AVK2_9BACT|nr:serine/threonine-protein kinase [Polyangium jinanense]MDC3957665.1 protein kinase [Polyangium jinanense]MDC3984365.1 protein kinase [Polyangium jinanense]